METVDYWLSVEKEDRASRGGAGPMVPTRVSLRRTRSVTTNTSQNHAADFRTALLQRHSSTCVVSGMSRLRQTTESIALDPEADG